MVAARPAPGATRPRYWPRRLLAAGLVVAVLGLVAAASGYAYLRFQLARIDRVRLPGLSKDDPGGVMNVLLVGSDSRAGLGGDLAEAAGKDSEGDRSGLSDTMMVLHVDPKAKQAAILSIPRDLYVPIAGTGGPDRINSAFALGGPRALIQTIQDSLGIQLNHYAAVDFNGFSNIVDTLGGLRIYLDAPARDDKSGLDLPRAGCVELDGFQALAYVRSRYFESFEAGRWTYDPTSDLGRIQRQQDFIRRMMKKALSSGLSNPLTLNRLVAIGVENLTIDSTMSTRDMVALARRFQSLDPDSVDMATLPGEPFTTAAGAQVLRLNRAEAQPLLDRINGRPPPGPVLPAEVQVRVLNGNGTDAAAARAGAALQGAGFTVTGTGDADAFSYDRTLIRYRPGALPKAQLLQGHLAGGADLVPDDALGTADLALVVGADYAGARAGPPGAAAAPPTAAPSPPAAAEGSGQQPC